MVVAIAALAGAAIGWRFPFLGQNRSTSQISTAQEGKQGQPARLKSSQPSKPKTVASGTDTNVNVDTDTTGNTDSGQSGSNQPVPALW